MIRASRRAASVRESRRFSWSLRNSVPAVSMPSASALSAMSLSRTGTRASWATSWAMPPPMVPAPSTATASTGRGSAPSTDSFFAASRKRKRWIRFLQMPDTARSASTRASASKPASRPCSRPTRTTSSARSGAG